MLCLKSIITSLSLMLSFSDASYISFHVKGSDIGIGFDYGICC